MLRVTIGFGILALAVSGCAGARPGPSCSMPASNCSAPCCTTETLCVEVVCEGVLYSCRELTSGRFEWLPNLPCTVDAGLVWDSGGPREAGASDGPAPKQDTPGPACGPLSCGACPAGYCGPNAECRFGSKCRCLGQWLNSDDKWENGCEVFSSSCSPSNCNACSLAYCGLNADCMQSKCKCNTGWFNCDTVWDSKGCECWAGCNGTSCQ